MFDTLVVPILLYGSEVWGIYNFKEIDKLHFKFCKHILGVRPQTSNAAVLGELGRFPLSVICKERALRFWIKIMKNPRSLIHSIFSEQLSIRTNDNKTWAASVKTVVDNFGFMWNAFDINNNYMPIIKPSMYKNGMLC